MLLSDIRKSVGSILYERVASPFSGAFILSWCVWNWEVLYLTLFVSESKIPNTKIDYITENFLHQSSLLWYPLLSTLILILIIPFLSNGSYWVHLKFRQWKLNQKDKVENKQLLSIEKSIELRRRIREREIELEKIIESKNDEIQSLEKTIREIQNDQTISQKTTIENLVGEYNPPDLLNEYDNFKSNSKAFKFFPKISSMIRQGIDLMEENIPFEITEYYILNDIIVKKSDGLKIRELAKPGSHHFTKKGEAFYRIYFDETF